MEAYPSEYVEHNLPLLILTGLERDTVETPRGDKSYEFLGDGGFRVRTELAPLHHPLTDDLRATLLSYDRSNAPWRLSAVEKTEQAHVFKIRSVGRTYNFPPRKAPPPPHSPRLRPYNDNVSPPPLILHSTLSPLSPSSPLYPDGIITPHWITKHQYRLPSVLISFYNLVSNSSTSSLEDNKIKIEVNNIRNLILSTNYKTKLVIVLVGDGAINNAELEERLVNIRRGTNFDSKALYYLPSASSLIEINDFVKVLLSTIYPTSIEYYRDLSKHARRKRNRNSVPQPTVPPTRGTSSVLSLQGWNVRYEFKLGIFAETRQELEAAARNYEQAYEALFHPELFGEAIPSWSTRFNEARMLADVTAIRIIRCFLWTSQTSPAVKWWLKHRDRVREVVDRRGKGTSNYGWEAWQSSWAKIMAQLIERSEVFTTSKPPSAVDHSLPIYLPIDRNAASIDRQSPWEYLHHAGYWNNKARGHTEARKSLVSQIPEEDRLSSSAQNNRKAQNYDTYLVSEPALEYTLLENGGDTYTRRICDTISLAVETFKARDQRRMVELLEFYRCAERCNAKSWSDASSALEKLWRGSSWRRSGWWAPLVKTGEHLSNVALQLGNAELALTIFYELGSLQSPETILPRLNSSENVSTAVDLKACLSQLTPSFAFASAAGHVGEHVAAQLTLRSSVPKFNLGLKIASLKLEFDGGLDAVLLEAVSSSEQPESQQRTTVIQDVELAEHNSEAVKESKRLSLTGTAYRVGNATFPSSTENTVFNIQLVPTEAGPVSVASIVILLSSGIHELTLNATDFDETGGIWWETRHGQPISRAFGMHRDVRTMTVLPKPPKVEIKLPSLTTAYYTGEKVELEIEVINEEDQTIQGDLRVRLMSSTSEPVNLRWKHEENQAVIVDGNGKQTTLPPTTIDEMPTGTRKRYAVLLDSLSEAVDHELEVQVSYELATESIALTKQIMVDLPVIRPFEAIATFLPRLHQEQWPDFFAAPEMTMEDQPHGLKQRYLVRTDIVSFAHESLVIRSLNLNTRRIVGGARCTALSGHLKSADASMKEISEAGFEILPDKTEHIFFVLEMQKLVLGDRSPVATEFAVDISWSRQQSSDLNTTTLVLPRFLAPMSEPRVLLQASKMEGPVSMYLLTYTIENPSMHFLTFNVTMDSGDGYAFSGSKVKSISLTPISRHDVLYRLHMQKSREWIKVRLDVLDAFFGQTLKIQPASDGVKVDKQGNVLIWSE